MVAAEKKAHGNRAAKLRAVHDYFYKGAIAKRSPRSTKRTAA